MRLLAARLAQVPLRRAVVEVDGRVVLAGSVGRGVAEVDDVAALAERLDELERSESRLLGLGCSRAAAAGDEHGQKDERGDVPHRVPIGIRSSRGIAAAARAAAEGRRPAPIASSDVSVPQRTTRPPT